MRSNHTEKPDDTGTDHPHGSTSRHVGYHKSFFSKHESKLTSSNHETHYEQSRWIFVTVTAGNTSIARLGHRELKHS